MKDIFLHLPNRLINACNNISSAFHRMFIKFIMGKSSKGYSGFINQFIYSIIHLENSK